MDYTTFSVIKAKVREDLGLEQETFVSDTELMRYCNEAIDDCESTILTTYEDYFLDYANIALVSGTSLYSLPSNIYATKIRGIVYNDGSLTYEIKRLRPRANYNRFVEIANAVNNANTDDDYKYIIVNRTATAGVQLKLVPAAQETSSDHVEVWFIRNANKITAESDYCDIPEFISFIYQFIKCKCYEKEGHPNLEVAMIERERLRKEMVETLSNMIIDENTEIDKDITFYEEMN